MARNPIILAFGLGGALALGAAQSPTTFAQAMPGLWEISGAQGMKSPARLCVADVQSLARFEHRGKSCSTKQLKNGGSTASFEYSCGGSGFGHSEITVLTPRSLRISTQGISDGAPFNYVLQAHRLSDCPVGATATAH